ncbi:MAG: hypothetical protein IT172_02935 [Acidobacteria bacterium]|nr:hypothetical protein [Acidobacteriota bacterium]
MGRMSDIAAAASEHSKERPPRRFTRSQTVWLSLLAGAVYFFSNPKPQSYYDYTFRVAANFLSGSIGFAGKPPSWLNEFVPFEGSYYSVFPLGSVLSMLPAALLKSIGIIDEMPARWIAALLAAAGCFFLLKIAERYDISAAKQLLMTFGILFGTFLWVNLSFAGAWQLALAFAMVGELGAIYFTVFDRRPALAGVFFALAFGNRTENLLTAPAFLYLMYRDGPVSNEVAEIATIPGMAGAKQRLSRLAYFCIVPFILGVLTLGYNYLRFHSITDFGYARIPGVLNEPWYDHGIFSTAYIPRQAWEMLLKMWHLRDQWPYLLPDRFSSSILLSSPFFFLLLRIRSEDIALKIASWAAVLILTFLLWIHGNSGGWQFGYRYATVLLPWAFLLMLDSAPKKITITEAVLYTVSFVANAYALWLFNWTEFMK